MLASIMTAYSCGTVEDSHPIPLPNAVAKLLQIMRITKRKRKFLLAIHLSVFLIGGLEIVETDGTTTLLHQNPDDTLGSTPVPAVGK
jgi:hypothetical protein